MVLPIPKRHTCEKADGYFGKCPECEEEENSQNSDLEIIDLMKKLRDMKHRARILHSKADSVYKEWQKLSNEHKDLITQVFEMEQEFTKKAFGE